MKMQSTEMEFVTFDAQDVIATSGEPKPYFSGSIKDIIGNTFNDKIGLPHSFMFKNDESTIRIAMWKSTIDTTGGTNYHILNSATVGQSGTTTTYAINATGTNDTPSGEYLDSLDKILGWLINYTTQ